MKYILLLINFYLFANFYAGYPGSNFNFGTDARNISMSNSLVSTYNKGFVAFNNPALLPKISDNEYGFSHFLMSLDRSLQSVSIARPLPPSAGVSLSFFRIGTENIIQTNSGFGDQLSTLRYSQGYGMLSFGIDLGSLSGGFNFKTFFNNMDIYKSDSSIGFDLGFLYDFNEYMNLGIKISNLSSSFNWDINHLNQNQSVIYEEEIPVNHMIGFSYNLPDRFILSCQVDYLPVKNSPSLSEHIYNKYKVGFEYYYNSDLLVNSISLRGGVSYIDNNIDYAFGFGIPFKISEFMILNIDYALDLGLVDQGLSHLFSFSLLNY